MLSETQVKEIIDKYQNKQSQKSIAKEYGLDKGTIKRLLLKNNIKIRTLSEASRKYSYNDNIFETIDSHEKAYWLGFIAADGCIINNRLDIGLSIKDYNHLVKFKEFVESNAPIRTYKVKSYDCCEFTINSRKIINDLFNLNITPNKSLNLKPPDISEEFYFSFILGLFGGDGGFCVNNQNTLSLYFCGTLEINKFIVNFLDKKLNIKINLREDKRHNNHYRFSISNRKNIIKIAESMYCNLNIFLERKNNIYKNYFIMNPMENYRKRKRF